MPRLREERKPDADRVGTVRLNFRVPTATYEEIEALAKEMGVYRTDYYALSLVIGARLLSHLSNPTKYLTTEQVEAAVSAASRVYIDALGGNEKLREVLGAELREEFQK